MMQFRIVKFAVAFVTFQFYEASAIDLKPHSVAHSHQLESDAGSVTDLINHSLLQNNDAVHRLLAESACPVCDGGRTLATNGSMFSNLKDALTGETEVWGTDEVPVANLVPVLTQAADQFTAIGQRLQASYSTFSADTEDVVVAIFDVLIGIVNAITNLLLNIISLIGGAISAVVILIAGIIISILDLIENIKLAIIEIIVNFLSSITGGKRNLREDESNSSLYRMLASGAFGGIFNNIITMLLDQNDDSGLIDVLRNSAGDMAAVEAQVNTFLEASSEVSTTTDEVAISADTINEILNAIVAIVFEILALIINIIVSILFLIVEVINAIAGLIIGIINSILNLIVSILNAILGVFSVQGGDGNNATTANSLSLIGVMSVVLKSPLTKIAWCTLRASDCGMSNEELECQIEALSCNSKALSGATA
jgi:hypothetical protein